MHGTGHVSTEGKTVSSLTRTTLGCHLHLDGLVAVGSLADTLAGDLGWVDEVFQDLVVNLLEGAGAGAWLLGARVAAWLADHAALGDEDDVTVGELLLELTGQSVHVGRFTVAERKGGMGKVAEEDRVRRGSSQPQVLRARCRVLQCDAGSSSITVRRLLVGRVTRRRG